MFLKKTLTETRPFIETLLIKKLQKKFDKASSDLTNVNDFVLESIAGENTDCKLKALTTVINQNITTYSNHTDHLAYKFALNSGIFLSRLYPSSPDCINKVNLLIAEHYKRKAVLENNYIDAELNEHFMLTFLLKLQGGNYQAEKEKGILEHINSHMLKSSEGGSNLNSLPKALKEVLQQPHDPNDLIQSVKKYTLRLSEKSFNQKQTFEKNKL